MGPCKSGKSLLKDALEDLGFSASHIAQEHSFAPQMWQIISNPDFLIFLDVDYSASVARGLNWTIKDYETQIHRLGHAKTNADVEIKTSLLSPQQVLAEALSALKKHGVS